MGPNESPGANRTDPAEKLLQLLGGKWLAAAVSAAASLGIADALFQTPRTLEDLADELSAEPDALHRLMRILLGEDLVFLNSDKQFELTEAGALLRSEELGELAVFVGSPFSWDPWSTLADAVRTGDSAFMKHHGLSLFDYLDHHSDHAHLYHQAIDGFSKREAEAAARAYDFSSARRVADIGGGQGRLLVEILSRWKHLEGVLFERPAAGTRAAVLFKKAAIADRCETQIGDFFKELPADVDVCILMHIIHCWDDATATDLLRRCANVVGPTGTVLIIEGLLVPDSRRDLTNLLDLEMLVLCGPGHERRKPEMRRLISAAGLRLENTVPLVGSIRLMITKPRA
jgi:hypothetical protein